VEKDPDAVAHLQDTLMQYFMAQIRLQLAGTSKEGKEGLLDLSPYHASQDSVVVDHTQNPRIVTSTDAGLLSVDAHGHLSRLHACAALHQDNLDQPVPLPPGCGIVVKGHETEKWQAGWWSRGGRIW
jgi:hypothetical protein